MKIEIERKFLIELPDVDVLLAQPRVRVLSIVQSYLTQMDSMERRVRFIYENGRKNFVFTGKDFLNDLSRLEEEYDISEYEYTALLVDEHSRLTKTRYSFPYEGHTLEVDIYPEHIGGALLHNKAVLEVELNDETEPFSLPSFIKIIREIDRDPDYTNHNLAQPIEK